MRKLVSIPTTFAAVVGSSLLVLALAACGQAAASSGSPDASTPDGQPATCQAACGLDDACCPAGCTAAADHDCRAPGPSRLVVLDHDGSIHVWNNTSTLLNRPADIVGRIERRWRVSNSRLATLLTKFGQRHRQLFYSLDSSFDD